MIFIFWMITSMCKRPLSFDPKWRCERIDFSIYNNNCFSLLLLLLSWIFLRQMSLRISNIRKFVMWNNIICSNHYYARHNKNMSFPCKSEFTIPFYFCSSSSETEMIVPIKISVDRSNPSLDLSFHSLLLSSFHCSLSTI